MNGSLAKGFLAMGVACSAPLAANATVLVSVRELGNDVYWHAFGSVDPSALTRVVEPPNTSRVVQGFSSPQDARFATGRNASFGQPIDSYYGTINKPPSFGTGAPTSGDAGSGPRIGINRYISNGQIIGPSLTVPDNYVSGDTIFSTMIHNNHSFQTLGLTPGLYSFSWGQGASFDRIILDIGGSGTPTTRQVAPTLDARAEWNGSGFDVSDGQVTVLAQRVPGIALDKRQIMEFELDPAPLGPKLSHATLSLDIASFSTSFSNGQTQYASLEIYGYVGDGLLSPGDATAGGVLLGTSQDITELGQIQIDLDPYALTTLMDRGAEFLGQAGISGEGGNSVSAYTTEGQALLADLLAPELTLTYDWASYLRGDLNGDGVVTNRDIAPFVLALTDAQGFDALYPFVDRDIIGDFTGDNTLTLADIAGFVGLLTGGADSVQAQSLASDIEARLSTTVPEPASSLLLLGLGGLACLRRRRR